MVRRYSSLSPALHQLALLDASPSSPLDKTQAQALPLPWFYSQPAYAWALSIVASRALSMQGARYDAHHPQPGQYIHTV